MIVLQLSMFLFVLNAEPHQNNEYDSNESQLRIWIRDQDIESAKARTIHYVRSHRWIPVEIVSACQILEEQVRGLDKAEASLFRRAQ